MKSTFAAIIVSLLVLASVSFADVPAAPSLPSFFSGSVSINGQPAPGGTVITAKIGNEVRGAITTEIDGQYGSDRKLLVTGSASDNGATIYFYVNNILAKQTAVWNEGAVYALNLEASTAPHPAPTEDHSPGSAASSGSSPSQKEEEKEEEPDEITFIEIDTLTVTLKIPAEITIAELDAKPDNVPSPDNPVYRYIEIITSKETGAIIRFRVEKSWLDANMIETVSLYRYSDAWSKLDTKKTDEDETSIYFESETPGFSIFAILGRKASQPVPEKETCPEERTIAYNPDTLECIEYPSKCAVPKNMIIADKCPQIIRNSLPPVTGKVSGFEPGSKNPVYVLFVLLIIAGVIFYYKKHRHVKPAKKASAQPVESDSMRI